MTGFVAGIGVVLMLSQLPTVTGYDAGDGGALDKAFDVLAHLGDVDLPTVALAAGTVALVVALRSTRLEKVGALIAIAVPSVVVAAAGLEGIGIVRDVGDIEGGFPLPSLPSPDALSPSLVTGAIAVAVVTSVQGAGISQSVAAAGEPRASMSRDFIASGAGNVAAGLFRGLPVGGSLKGTALNVSAGGLGRWAVISSGLLTILVVVALSGLVMSVAMPALGALLIVVSLGTIRLEDAAAVQRAGWSARIAALTAFACTLLLPIQAAVAIGVALAGLLHVTSAATDIKIVRLVERPDGSIEERRPPQRLPERAVTVLDVYGSLFYAAARTFEGRLPRAGGEAPVVVLRLRGRPQLGATIVEVLADYSEQLRRAGGRLYLAGLDERARSELLRDERFTPAAGVEIHVATSIRRESTRAAVAAADEWLLTRREPGDEPGAGGEE